jgi:hypothetical protein
MIIDDNISFFGVYYHNCILNLNLSKEFSDLYSKIKYKKVILCQKDQKNCYLLTESLSDQSGKMPQMKSYYFLDKTSLKDGYKQINNTIDSSEKTFYLIRYCDISDFNDSEKIVEQWKKEVRHRINEQ